MTDGPGRDAESEPPRGEESNRSGGGETPPSSDGTVRVLHVDDDSMLLDLAEEFLARADPSLDVLTETGAEAALSTLASTRVDCVVSDYDMPGTDGLEFLEAVREHHGDLPFVLFTGKGSEEIASEAISAGVTDYLQKGGGREQYEILANRIASYVDRRRTAAALAESERRLSTLMDNLPGMVYRCLNEPAWPMEFVSEGSLDIAGYPPENLESGRVRWGEDVVHPDDQDAVWEDVQDALAAGEPFEVTYRALTADGEERGVWEQGEAVRDASGEVVALEGFITDVTERHRLESELRRAAGRFEAVVEASPEPIVALDVDGNVTLWNAAAEETFGWDAESVLGEPLPLVPSGKEAEHRAILERVLSGESIESMEVERVDANGVPICVSVSTAPLTDADGEVTGIMSVVSRTDE